MARQQQDREDLLKEASGLVERAELSVDGFQDPVIVGFRTSGAGAVYFGAEPVYQFNTNGELRRGYFQGKLIKAEDRRLVSLDRKRQDGQVQMLRHEFTEIETKNYLNTMQQHLTLLCDGLKQERFTLLGQVPEEINLVERIQAWLETLLGETQIADTPHAK